MTARPQTPNELSLSGNACGDKKGTPAGSSRHYRAGERPCEECRLANAEASTKRGQERRLWRRQYLNDLRKQEGECWHCKCPLDFFDRESKNYATFDHRDIKTGDVGKMSHEGFLREVETGNIWLACQTCNLRSAGRNHPHLRARPFFSKPRTSFSEVRQSRLVQVGFSIPPGEEYEEAINEAVQPLIDHWVEVGLYVND